MRNEEFASDLDCKCWDFGVGWIVNRRERRPRSCVVRGTKPNVSTEFDAYGIIQYSFVRFGSVRNPTGGGMRASRPTLFKQENI